jgi:penicillin amidase
LLWFKRVLWILGGLVIIGLLTATFLVNPFGPSPINDYPTDGTIAIEGMKAPVRVYRDEKGMAYIHAENKADLIMAQGYVTAMDRLFQMQLTRLFSSGRIGELAGPGAKSVDLKMRTLGFRRNAQKHLTILNEETRQFLQHYADGVNAFIRSRPGDLHLAFKLAGIKPEPWHPVDTLTIMYFMGWQSAANLQHEIVTQMLIEKLGPAGASELLPLNINPAESEAASMIKRTDLKMTGLGVDAFAGLASLFDNRRLQVGSNNWVVDAAHSTSGKPIVANDPHLEASMLPGPWYPSGLISDHIRAVGVTIPGIPGMVVGRSAAMAFGVTNAYGDSQDLYVETLDPENENHYLEGDTSVAFQVIHETLRFKDQDASGGYRQEKIAIRRTRRGPVISDLQLDGLQTDKVMTVRWSAFENMKPSIALERTLSCRSIECFRNALKSVNYIALNWVFADENGDIGWHVSGQLPIRTDGDGTSAYQVVGHEDNWQAWIPFEQMPQATNPAEGWISTANHKTVDHRYPFYYSNYYSTSYRQRRLMELLGEPGKKGAPDHWRYQRDILNLKAKALAPIMAAALLGHDDTTAMGRILKTWDATDAVDQPGPTVFHAVFNEFAYLTFIDELGADLVHTMLSNTYFWEERLVHMMIGNTSPWFDDQVTSDRVETRDDLLHRAALNIAERMRKELGNDPQDWHWGKVHRYDFYSPVARSGALKKWLGGGDYPAAGSGDTLCRSLFEYNDLRTVAVMASLRMVVDLGDADKIMAVLPGGVAGRLFHPHTTNQIEPFINGDPVYWWFSDPQIKSHAKHELILTSADRP